MNKNIEVLQEVLDLLEEEKRKFYSLINENDFRIEEINSYLKELSKNEEDDFKVFSPRSAENKHRRQIESDTSEKKKYEEENVEYQKKIEYLKLLISKVNVVVDNLHMEDESFVEPPIENNLEKSNIEYGNVEPEIVSSENRISDNNRENSNVQYFISEKNHLAHQILNCVSFIMPDPERAKIELTEIAKKIKEN